MFLRGIGSALHDLPSFSDKEFHDPICFLVTGTPGDNDIIKPIGKTVYFFRSDGIGMLALRCIQAVFLEDFPECQSEYLQFNLVSWFVQTVIKTNR